MTAQQQETVELLFASFADVQKPKQLTPMDGDYEAVASDMFFRHADRKNLDPSTLFTTISFPWNNLLLDAQHFFLPGLIKAAYLHSKIDHDWGGCKLASSLLRDTLLIKKCTVEQREAVMLSIKQFSVLGHKYAAAFALEIDAALDLWSKKW
jgi:hypothetical protein